MTDPAYPAARIVAPRVRAHFELHAQEAKRRGRLVLAPPPDVDTVEALIDVAFWASLRREETYVPKISLAFLTPEAAAHPMMFERPLPLVPGALVKVAPAVERPGIHLGVAQGESGLAVWGTVRAIPFLCFVVEVAAPGLLVVKHHRGEESGKFVNVAVIEGDQIKIVDETASSLPDCPPLLTSLLGFDSPASWSTGVDSVNILVQLAASMRAHGRGGLLLVVPRDGDEWHESIVRPIPYAVVPPFPELAELTRESPDAKLKRPWQDAVNRAVEAIAGPDRGGWRDGADEPVRAAGVRHEDRAAQGLTAGRAGDADRARRGKRREDRASNAAWRHPSSFSGAVRPRSAGRGRARGVAGWPLHGLCVVAVRGDGPRAQGRDVAPLRI